MNPFDLPGPAFLFLYALEFHHIIVRRLWRHVVRKQLVRQQQLRRRWLRRRLRGLWRVIQKTAASISSRILRPLSFLKALAAARMPAISE